MKPHFEDRPPLPERVGSYRILHVVGRGNMGVVYLAEQNHPHRRVALKMIRPSANSKRIVRRFRNEVEILGQLEHPGIAQIFEAGSVETESGSQPYFAMEYIHGLILTQHAQVKKLGIKTRLELIARVCDSVQYAHQKGFIHRDLKPENILVTDLGEPKILDFGLARVTEPGAEATSVLTDTAELVGTVSHMSPEQRRPDWEVDTRSDIYSLGVILYQTVANRLPFDLAGKSPLEALRTIEESQPRPLDSNLGMLRDDLETVVEKAMEKERERRYQTAGEMAADLRRILNDEPIAARRSSTIHLLRKLLRRHPGSTWGIAIAFLALTVSLVLSASTWRRAVGQRESARRHRDTARESLRKFDRMADVTKLLELEHQAANELWPALPHRIPKMETWAKTAGELKNRLPGHQEALASMRQKALEYDETQKRLDVKTHPRAVELDILRALKSDFMRKIAEAKTRREIATEEEKPSDTIHRFEGKVAKLEDRLVELDKIVSRRRTWKFARELDQWTHDTLRELVRGIEAFVDPLNGTMANVAKRLAFAKTVRERTIEDFQEDWNAAIDSIQDPEECPKYNGLKIAPQVGLVPIGRDQRSGLWEFADIQTGEIPRRKRGRLELKENTGLVFVLLPPGTFNMGAERPSPGNPVGNPNVDPEAETREGPVHRVSLDPFFLSKYEMTQAQWERVSGQNPSLYPLSPLHPVEQVSWEACRLTLFHLGLEFPTEEQWEYASRAGTTGVWWIGNNKRNLRLSANVADQSLKDSGGQREWAYEKWNDGHSFHAPVGSFKPNPFGLCNMLGNVAEWCRDWYGSYNVPPNPRDDMHPVVGFRRLVARGGAHSNIASHARSSFRHLLNPGYEYGNVGLRPARCIDPPPLP